MSVKNENAAGGENVVLERPVAGGVYASLFEKINLNPVSELSALDIWQDAQAMSDATADERLTAGMQVFIECLTKSGSKVEKLDKHLIDHHIAALDDQISRQLDAVIYLFNRLIIILQPNGERLEWQEKHNRRIPG